MLCFAQRSYQIERANIVTDRSSCSRNNLFAKYIRNQKLIRFLFVHCCTCEASAAGSTAVAVDVVAAPKFSIFRINIRPDVLKKRKTKQKQKQTRFSDAESFDDGLFDHRNCVFVYKTRLLQLKKSHLSQYYWWQYYYYYYWLMSHDCRAAKPFVRMCNDLPPISTIPKKK